jgi:hypothetical protein
VSQPGRPQLGWWNAHRILVGKPLEKFSLGRPRRSKNNIKGDLREIGCEDKRWVELVQDSFQW